METGQVPELLHRLLESSNLLLYENVLLEQGADDVDQLVGLTAEEFQQLCSMIGMDKKPFHVMRLRKALDKYSETPLNSTSQLTTVTQTQPKQPVSNTSTSDSIAPATSNQMPTVETLPTLDPVNTSAVANQTAPSKELPNPPSVNHQLNQEASVKLFLPPYLHPDCESSDFSPLVDEQTPVQTTLEQPPCKPDTWDTNRKVIIRKYAAIYGRNFDKRQKEVLTPFEEHVNEAAYQLCLRDPTLLVRRDELFLLAKRAVKEGGYTYCHGASKTLSASSPSIGQKRTWEGPPLTPDSPSQAVPPSPSKSSPTVRMSSNTKRLHLDANHRLSTKDRVNRMYSLQAEIEINKALQREKINAMEEAKRNGHFSKSFTLQLEVESLGIECQELEGVYSVLKRKQARSNRYYRDKEKEQNEGGLEGNTDGTQISPEPVRNRVSSYEHEEAMADLRAPKAQREKERAKKVKVTVVRDKSKATRGKGGSEAGIKDLVENVSNATDQLNSLISGDYGKEMNW